MKDVLEFLGTGAADWSMNDRGPFFRRNSAALLNGAVMIDCGPHIWDYTISTYGRSVYQGVHMLLVTHPHGDHFCRESVARLADGRRLSVLGDEATVRLACSIEGVDAVPAPLFEETVTQGYTCIPVPANHAPDQESFQARHYIITTPNGGTVFYGLDGAWFENAAWHEMCRHRYDIMVLDCTVGDKADWRLFEHNTIPMLRIMAEGIMEKGLLKEGGRIYASHLARTLHASYAVTEELLSDFGVLLAYDGLTIIF